MCKLVSLSVDQLSCSLRRCELKLAVWICRCCCIVIGGTSSDLRGPTTFRLNVSGIFARSVFFFLSTCMLYINVVEVCLFCIYWLNFLLLSFVFESTNKLKLMLVVVFNWDYICKPFNLSIIQYAAFYSIYYDFPFLKKFDGT